MRALFHPVRCLGRWILMLGLVASASACNTYEPGIPLPDILDEVNATLAPNLVRLKQGDELTVTFRLEEVGAKYNQELRVGPSGRISMTGFPEKDLVQVDAVGMSLEELDATLERLMSEHVGDSTLELEIKKLASREVVFIGDMKNRNVSVLPNMYVDFIETMARIRADGNSFTLLESVVLIRWMNDEQRRRYWVIDARERFWTTPERLFLQEGDIVYFPTHPIKRAGDWIREITRLIPLPQIVRFP